MLDDPKAEYAGAPTAAPSAAPSPQEAATAAVPAQTSPIPVTALPVKRVEQTTGGQILIELLSKIFDSAARVHLDSEISRLKDQISQQAEELREKDASSEKARQEVQSLQEKVELLHRKERKAHLLTRVSAQAGEKLLTDEGFCSEFECDDFRPAFVLAIDLRRSTELMLKAREPKLYAGFITTLTDRLRKVVIDHYGIFDKFTGDGVLAFFPEFYSGPHAGFLAGTAAKECHQVFGDHFIKNRGCFVSVLKDVGLGIGLDFGRVQIVHFGSELTVVGTPVVYASRMAGAPPGRTFANQPAYEMIAKDFADYFQIAEAEIVVKSEGPTLAYEIRRNDRQFMPKLPPWALASTG